MSLTPEQIDPMLVAADTEFRKLLEKLDQKRAYLVAWQKHAADCLGRHRRGDRLPTSVFEEIKRLVEQELAAGVPGASGATTPGLGVAPPPAPPTFGFGGAPSTAPASSVFAPPASTTTSPFGSFGGSPAPMATDPFGFASSSSAGVSNPFSSSGMFGSSSSSSTTSSNPFAHFGK